MKEEEINELLDSLLQKENINLISIPYVNENTERLKTLNDELNEVLRLRKESKTKEKIKDLRGLNKDIKFYSENVVGAKQDINEYYERKAILTNIIKKYSLSEEDFMIIWKISRYEKEKIFNEYWIRSLKTQPKENVENKVRYEVYDSSNNFIGYKIDELWTLNKKEFKKYEFGKLEIMIDNLLIFLNPDEYYDNKDQEGILTKRFENETSLTILEKDILNGSVINQIKLIRVDGLWKQLQQ